MAESAARHIRRYSAAMAARVGFIGLGIMGSRMAANLAGAGFDLVVWNRTASKAREWAAEHGAAVAESPADVAARSDIVITMVVDGDQVESVLLGDEGVADFAQEELLCIDMSTIGPRAARRIAERLAERGIEFMDAPVTGSSPKAEGGTLTIMAGGSPQAFERARPLFDAMGELIVHVGDLGQGQLVKVINNAVAAANTTVVAEALLAGKLAGADLDALVTVMQAGSGASAMLQMKAGPMRDHDWTTLFKLEHMLKDLRLCLEEAKAVGARMELVEDTAAQLAAAERQGLGERDFAAVLEVVEERSGARL
jgi:3-hydroxyisobutyrate dehydrogenase